MEKRGLIALFVVVVVVVVCFLLACVCVRICVYVCVRVHAYACVVCLCVLVSHPLATRCLFVYFESGPMDQMLGPMDQMLFKEFNFLALVAILFGRAERFE